MSVETILTAYAHARAHTHTRAHTHSRTHTQAPPPPPTHTHTHASILTIQKLNLNSLTRTANRLETDQDSSTERKTRQVYSLEKNVFRLNSNETRELSERKGKVTQCSLTENRNVYLPCLYLIACRVRFVGGTSGLCRCVHDVMTHQR